MAMIVGKGESGALEAARLKATVEVHLHTNVSRLEIRGMNSEDDSIDVMEGFIRKGVPQESKSSRDDNKATLIEVLEHSA